MVKKTHLYSIFLPAIILVLGFFSFRLYQYISIFSAASDDSSQTADGTQLFTIPISAIDPILGNKRAPKTMIAFEDVQCEHCSQLYSIIKEFNQLHPDILKVIWKPTSITSIPFSSKTAHTYLLCASEEKKFQPFLESLFINQDQLSTDLLQQLVATHKLNSSSFTSCLTEEKIQTYLDETKQLAEFLQIQSVPALFIENRQIPTPQTVHELEILLGIAPSTL